MEEIRILREICSWIREDSDQIAEQLAILIHLDLLNSIASFAASIEAEVPRIAVGLPLRLVQARHPILLLLQREGSLSRTVPLDLSLGDEDSVMIITGPNAGGKTIALKTTGLLFLMALSGIPVPAHGSSSFPFITSLLVDIGDEQSIQSSPFDLFRPCGEYFLHPRSGREEARWSCWTNWGPARSRFRGRPWPVPCSRSCRRRAHWYWPPPT